MGFWPSLRRWIACTVLVHYTFLISIEPVVWASRHVLYVQVHQNKVAFQAFEGEWDEASSTFKCLTKPISSKLHSSKPFWGDLQFEFDSKTLNISKKTPASLLSKKSKTSSSLNSSPVDVLQIQSDQPLVLTDLELLSLQVFGPYQASAPQVTFKATNTFHTSFLKVRNASVELDAQLVFKKAPSQGMKWRFAQSNLPEDLLLDHVFSGGELANKGLISFQSDSVEVFLERLTNHGTVSGSPLGALNLYTPSQLDNHGTMTFGNLTLQADDGFYNHGFFETAQSKGIINRLYNTGTFRSSSGMLTITEEVLNNHVMEVYGMKGKNLTNTQDIHAHVLGFEMLHNTATGALKELDGFLKLEFLTPGHLSKTHRVNNDGLIQSDHLILQLGILQNKGSIQSKLLKGSVWWLEQTPDAELNSSEGLLELRSQVLNKGRITLKILQSVGRMDNQGTITTTQWEGGKESSLINSGLIRSTQFNHDKVTNEAKGYVQIADRSSPRVLINHGVWETPVLNQPGPSSLENRGTLVAQKISVTEGQNHGTIQSTDPLHLNTVFLAHGGIFKTPHLTLKTERLFHNTSPHPWPEHVEAEVGDFLNDATGELRVQKGFLKVDGAAENRGFLSVPLLQGQGTFTNTHKAISERITLQSLYNQPKSFLGVKHLQNQRLENEGHVIAQDMEVQSSLDNKAGAFIASDTLKTSKKFQNKGQVTVQKGVHLQDVTLLIQEGDLSSEILALPPLSFDLKGSIQSKMIRGKQSSIRNLGTLKAQNVYLRTLENEGCVEATHLDLDSEISQEEHAVLRTKTLKAHTLLNKGPITVSESIRTTHALHNQSQGDLKTPLLKASGTLHNQGQMTMRTGDLQGITLLSQKGIILSEALTLPPLELELEGTLQVNHLKGSNTTIRHTGALKSKELHLKKLQNEGIVEAHHLRVTELDNRARVQAEKADLQKLLNTHEALFNLLNADHVENTPQGAIHLERAVLKNVTNQGEISADDLRSHHLHNEGLVSSSFIATQESLHNQGTITASQFAPKGIVENHGLIDVQHPGKASASLNQVTEFKQKGQLQIQKASVSLPVNFTNEGTLLLKESMVNQGSIINKGTMQASDTTLMPIENQGTLILGPGRYGKPITNTGTLSLFGSDFSLTIGYSDVPSCVRQIANTGLIESDGKLYAPLSLGGQLKTTQSIQVVGLEATPEQLVVLNDVAGPNGRWKVGERVIVFGKSMELDRDVNLLYPLKLCMGGPFSVKNKRFTTTRPLDVQCGGMLFENAVVCGPNVDFNTKGNVAFYSTRGAFSNLNVQAKNLYLARHNPHTHSQYKFQNGPFHQGMFCWSFMTYKGFEAEETKACEGQRCLAQNVIMVSELPDGRSSVVWGGVSPYFGTHLKTTHFSTTGRPTVIQVTQDLGIDCSEGVTNYASRLYVGGNLKKNGHKVSYAQVQDSFKIHGLDSREMMAFTYIDKHFEHWGLGRVTQRVKGNPIPIHSPDPEEHGKTVIPAVVQVGGQMTISTDLVSIMNAAISASHIDITTKNMLFKQTEALEKKLPQQGKTLMLDLGLEAQSLQSQGIFMPNAQGSLTFSGESLALVDPKKYGIVGQGSNQPQVPYLSEDALDHVILQTLSKKLGRLYDNQGRPILSMLQNMRQKGLSLKGQDEASLLASHQVQNIQDHFMVMVRQQIRDQVFAVPRLFLDMESLYAVEANHPQNRQADLQAHTLSIKASNDVTLHHTAIQVLGDATIHAGGRLLQESLVKRSQWGGGDHFRYQDSVELTSTMAVGGDLKTHGGLSNTRKGTAFVVGGHVEQTSAHRVEEIPLSLESYSYDRHVDSGFWSDSETITIHHTTTHVPNLTVSNQTVTSKAPQVHLQGSQVIGRQGILLGQTGSDIRVTPIVNTQMNQRTESDDGWFSSSESSAVHTAQTLSPSTFVTEKEGTFLLEGKRVMLEAPQIKTGSFQDFAHQTVVRPGVTQDRRQASSSSSNLLGSSSGEETYEKQTVHPATIQAERFHSISLEPASLLQLTSTQVDAQKEIHIQKEKYVESTQKHTLQHHATHEGSGFVIPALNNPLEHLPFMGVDRPQDVWGGIKTANSLLSDGNLVLSAANKGITDPSVLTSFAGRFTNLTFTDTHTEMTHEHTRDEPTVLRSGGTMTFETERTHFKGLHQAQGNLAIQTEHLTSEPLVETDRREQRSETTSVSFNPLTVGFGFSGQEGTGRGWHKQHQRTHVISEETLTLNADTAELVGTQMQGRTLEGRVGHLTMRHVADQHEEESHNSSFGVNISFMPGMMQGLPMPSIAENDNEDFEHVIRQGRSGLHANDNLMQITEQEEFADEEYHHQDSSSFAFHPGELVSLVQNFDQFSENFETLVATLRPAKTYKTAQEEQVLEAYHQTQVNDAKETLTDLAQRLRESRKDAVERVLARLEKEAIGLDDPEAQSLIDEGAQEYEEASEHHLKKMGGYLKEQITDRQVAVAVEQGLEFARSEGQKGAFRFAVHHHAGHIRQAEHFEEASLGRLVPPLIKLVVKYAKQIEQLTGRKFSKTQLGKLKDQVKVKKFEKMGAKELEEHRKIFRNPRTKDRLIQEWEKKEGQKWPEVPELDSQGVQKIDPKTGMPKFEKDQAHHIIPQELGGPHEWWNIFPVPQKVHQGGVHGSGSELRKILDSLKGKDFNV